MFRVLVADDHAIVRKGLRQWLELNEDIVVVAEAETAQQVMEWLVRESFDIVLLDLSMPGTRGTELIGKIRARNSELPILVLSMHNDAQIAVAALQAGASGYLTKDSDPERLPVALRTVASGGRCIDPKLALDTLFEGLDLSISNQKPVLSSREMQVVKLLVHGHSLHDIADSLAIERGTVSTYKTRIMRKMGFRNNTELMRYALSQGW